jgi:hypothetical protein
VTVAISIPLGNDEEQLVSKIKRATDRDKRSPFADPQKKIFTQNQSDYIVMRVIGESSKNPMGKFHRFRFEGDRLSVKMNNGILSNEVFLMVS